MSSLVQEAADRYCAAVAVRWEIDKCRAVVADDGIDMDEDAPGLIRTVEASGSDEPDDIGAVERLVVEYCRKRLEDAQ
jgi:hypothetical protein